MQTQDQSQTSPQQQSGNPHLPKQALVDAQIACGVICSALLSDKGIQQVKQLLQTAKDPVQVVAHVIFIAIHQAEQKITAKKIKLDNRIWTCDGGVLDRVLFEEMGVLYAVLKYPKAQDAQFVHDVKAAILVLMDNDDKANGADIDGQDDDTEGSPSEEANESPEEEKQEQASGQAAPQQQQPKGLVAPGGQ